MTVELLFTCPVCLLDWPDPICESCGARLMPKLVAVPDPPKSPWLRLMEDITRAHWPERKR